MLTGASLTIPKQPVNGGVGGNPYIYIKFTDGQSNDLSDEVLLGRCVQGMKISSDLIQNAMAVAHVSSGNCSNKGGPTISVDGEITLGGLHATFIFRNNPKGTHTTEDSRDVVIIGEGSKDSHSQTTLQGRRWREPDYQHSISGRKYTGDSAAGARTLHGYLRFLRACFLSSKKQSHASERGVAFCFWGRHREQALSTGEEN